MTHAPTTKKAITKAKKFSSEFSRSEGNMWVESVDAPATRTEQGGYKVHYVGVLRHSES